jgi:hypothetical protein
MKPDAPGWPVDGHVHFHSLDAVAPTLDAAARHFRPVSGRREGLLGVLLLTQTSTERVFEALEAAAGQGDWALTGVPGEPETLLARRGAESVAVVCGRQVRAADGLEVLALGTRQVFRDGMPFPEALDAVRSSGALTVIPWGFGKWLGARGRRVEQALEKVGREAVFVGDNGSRLSLAGQPALVRAAQQRGFRVLPGTDPFPFAAGYRRVGQFGFLADVELAEEAPWRALQDWLLARSISPRPYGNATGPMTFVFNQLGIQVYNRFLRKKQA